MLLLHISTLCMLQAAYFTTCFGAISATGAHWLVGAGPESHMTVMTAGAISQTDQLYVVGAGRCCSQAAAARRAPHLHQVTSGISAVPGRLPDHMSTCDMHHLKYHS
jgi:hypothetical protein